MNKHKNGQVHQQDLRKVTGQLMSVKCPLPVKKKAGLGQI